MSDDKPKRDDGSSSIPPELKPFVGQHEWPEAERRDEAEVDAAFAPVEAMVAEWQREADKRDAARGVGNVSAYAAGVVIREAEKPAAGADEPKVSLAIVDVPRKLPAGNPNLPTEEISTRAFSRAGSGDDEVTRKRAATELAGTTGAAAAPRRPERTVGGNTEKMPVIPVPAGAASPWTEPGEGGSPAAEALPSALRAPEASTHEDDAPGSVTPAASPAEGRARWRGVLLAGAVALLAVAVGVRAMTRATTDGNATRTIASGGAAAPSATPSARAVEPKATSEVAPPVAPSATSANARATASAQVPPPSVPTAHPLAPPQRATSAPLDDPYDAAPRPPAPQPTALPVAPPPQPTVQPAAPAPQPTAQPAAPAPPPPVSTAPAATQKPAVPPTSSPGPLGGPPVY